MLNHKLLSCACCLLSLLLTVALAPARADEPTEPLLLKHINLQNLDGAGQYRYEIEVSNNISASAQGNVNGVRGEYFLPGEEGEPPKRVTYTADATGFHPEIH